MGEYRPIRAPRKEPSISTDWRDELLSDVVRQPAGPDRPAALWWGRGPVAGTDVVACVSDFAVHGGTWGAAEADVFVAACAAAARDRRPLLTWLRTGGTRLQEGIGALVGIPRAVLGLDRLAGARQAHVCVVDQPTTGGVWASVGSSADLRVAVAGATVGFSGPRVVAATTGEPLPAGANTAESAAAAGLVDAVRRPAELADWLRRALAAVAGPPSAASAPSTAPQLRPTPPDRPGWQQVHAARAPGRPDGAALLGHLLVEPVRFGPPTDGTGADPHVAAAVGRTGAGHPVVAVALAAGRGGRPTPGGYRLLTRAARLADRVGAGLVTLVDTPGADPRPGSEDGGLAGAIAEATATMLACRAPTVAVLHGEGGSGGALAASVADRVLVTPDSYFAALAPEGAAAALRRSPEAAAELLRLTPAALLEAGFADELVDPAPDRLGPLLGAGLAELAARPAADRLARRRRRWSERLPSAP